MKTRLVRNKYEEAPQLEKLGVEMFCVNLHAQSKQLCDLHTRCVYVPVSNNLTVVDFHAQCGIPVVHSLQ